MSDIENTYSKSPFVLKKMHLLDFTSISMGGPPSGGYFFLKMTPSVGDLLRQQRRAAKFHAESSSYHAEINFLGLFREHRGFCFSTPLGADGDGDGGDGDGGDGDGDGRKNSQS